MPVQIQIVHLNLGEGTPVFNFLYSLAFRVDLSQAKVGMISVLVLSLKECRIRNNLSSLMGYWGRVVVSYNRDHARGVAEPEW